MTKATPVQATGTPRVYQTQGGGFADQFGNSYSSPDTAGTINTQTGTKGTQSNTASKTPTVITDENIRSNVIPEIQGKASDMLDYNVNQLYLRPGESPQAYKARVAQIQGGQSQDTETNNTGGNDEYSDLYKSILGENPQQDSFYDSSLELLKSMQNTSDTRTANQLAGINAQFELRKQDLQAKQQSEAAANKNALLTSGGEQGGSFRYAPISSNAFISAEQRGFVRDLAAVDLQEQQATNEALAAQADNDYKLLGQKLDVLGKKRQEKLDIVNKLYDNMVAEKKQTAKDINDVVASLQSAPPQVLNAVSGARSLPEAVALAGPYLVNGTGVVGEWQSVNAARAAKGMSPIDIEQYMNEDANRKRSITNNYLGGISNTQLTKATTIADQFKNEQTVQNYQTIAQGLEAFKTLGSSPADDIQRIYTFAKTMDPNSAVREGEYKTVQEYAQAYLPSLGIKTQRLVDNRGFLTQEARDLMEKSLDTKFKPVENSYNQIRNSYASRINKITGLDDGKDYLTDYAQPATEDSIRNEEQTLEKISDWVVQNPKNADAYETVKSIYPGQSTDFYRRKLQEAGMP